MGLEIDMLIVELEEKYSNIVIDDNAPTIEEILELFDKNGNWKTTESDTDDDSEQFLIEMEDKYGEVELTEDSPSIDEILAEYDENGNKIENKADKEDVNGAAEVTDEVIKSKRRRKRRRNANKKEDIQILHSNTCGYSSKQDCWENILKKEQPEVVTLNETALKGNTFL